MAIMKQNDVSGKPVETIPELPSEPRPVPPSMGQRTVSLIRKIVELYHRIYQGKLLTIVAVCGVFLSICLVSYIAYLSHRAIKVGRMANSCLVETRGVVQLQRETMDDAYRGRIRFLSGDVIRTGDSGICIIKMNRTIVTVGSNSFLTVSMYENGNRTVYDAILHNGSASVHAGKMDKTTLMRIRTDLADIKAKGTRFAVCAGLDGSTRVSVAEGKVLVVRKNRDPIVLENRRTMEINHGGAFIERDVNAAANVDTIFDTVPMRKTDRSDFNSGNGYHGVTVRVNAGKKWQKTGLRVQKGDIVYLSATGSISITTQGDSRVNIPPEGRLIPELKAPPIFPGLGFGILVMRIGEDIEPVGRMRRVESSGSGEIELCVNDNILEYRDNSGFFNVEVFVEKKK
jgi:hypothetical protein